MDPFRVRIGVPIERLDQGTRGARNRDRGASGKVADRRGRTVAPWIATEFQPTQQIARGFRRDHGRLGNTIAELPLEARQQLHARQTVESEVATEHAVEMDIDPIHELWMQFPDYFSHRGKQPFGADLRIEFRRRRGIHRLQNQANDKARV